MSKTKKPTGPSITRNGNKFTLKWKMSDKDYGNGQEFAYLCDRAKKDDKWSKAEKLKETVKEHSYTIKPGDYHPNAKKPKLTKIKLRIRGNRKKYKKGKKEVNPGWSDWAVGEFQVNAPPAPSLVAELDNNLTNKTKFTFAVSTSNTSNVMFTDIQYQSMLVKDCNQKDGSKLTWKSKAGNDWKSGTKSGSSYVEITEDTSTLAKGSYTRWFRVRARGPAGDSAWKYAKHVYASTNQAKISGAPVVSETEENGLTIKVDWKVGSSASKPIDQTVAQYCMVVPAAGMECPSGASWTDANISADTAGTDTAVITVDDQLDVDQCLFVRINTKHDSNITYGRPTLALAGNVKDPSGLSVSTDQVTHRATISAANNSEIPDACLAVVYRPSSDATNDLIVGIMQPGTTSVTVQCPDWSDEDAVAFGVYAFVGSFKEIEREDNVDAYNVAAKMKSAATVWDGGAVPKEPTGVEVTATETPGTIMVEWDWTWDAANSAEISWADHEDAWESTDEPETYTISNLHASKWYISGLETGIAWYVRVRLLDKGTDDKVTYGPWSDTISIDLSSAPSVPVLYLSAGAITEDGTVTASWAYSAEDGTTQLYADICEATIEQGEIVHGDIIAHTESAQHIDVSARDAGWQAGETHMLCVRVMSSAGKLSDSWSDPVAVAVADPLVASITSTSLVMKSIPEGGTERSVLSLTEMPLEITVSGAPESGETSVVIERVGDYRMERPDETESDGYDGETIAKTTIGGAGEISFDLGDIILSLDDGASYRIVATAKDGLGQTASDELEFEVHWDHQAVMPEAITRVDQDNYVAMIKILSPDGAEETDRVDIYRLSADRPELIVKDGELGKTYVDQYPTLGEMGGHRVVFRTANGDYITEDQRLAWIDLGEEAYDRLDSAENIINFGNDRVGFAYNVDLSTKWAKEFESTSYLDGSVQGDWNPAVKREATINTVVLTDDVDTVRAFRRLAVYAGICHVRTLDGSSFSADVQVQEDRKFEEAHKLASFSLAITRVDPETLDGIELEEWW